ncbi:DUF421 domain-containing protein [Peribacillus castrilensis]|uniref:YetF C-terminal domain-containing protein n=1 Tax=Peribacillus simplex TaxID=1478 RepID=A0AAN2PDK6_9BACI|nr:MULTISPECIES: DUF421 domain-containing protein [Bacillaceae]MCP1095075.1 DUF421 domain-containing protein [Bacillaceae bacterium OS4b]MCF7620610.1 DUF421 domain-containing protein [Peribacillus frigoritolerans]MCP1151267.1 DUF421 domain-containing protein [Peribacillus frigoritolerans]MCT1388993.1 DUF421 domain-containing protein [Peribacillus frigoritolerans]MEA3575041.1 DUF421 domain-containing protein [Peribacillus frigoritolerans]
MPDWIEILLRSFFFLIVLFLITKVLGKKQLSQLSFFEYVTGITIGNVGAELATKVEGNIIHGVLSILVFAIAPFIAGLISLKSKTFRDLIEGKASVFIKDGKVMEDNLKKEKYTIDELLGLLRKKDVFDISEVEFALLEANGDFSVMLKKQNQPVTPKDLNLPVAAVKEPQTIIMDGLILDEPLSTIGLNRHWLHTELDKLGVILENVFLGQANSNGELTVDLFDDKLKVPSPQEKPLMLATLKKCQADLELFALGTESKEAKEMFSKNSEKLQKAIDNVAHILRN